MAPDQRLFTDVTTGTFPRMARNVAEVDVPQTHIVTNGASTFQPLDRCGRQVSKPMMGKELSDMPWRIPAQVVIDPTRDGIQFLIAIVDFRNDVGDHLDMFKP